MKIESRHEKTKTKTKKDYKFIMNPDVTGLLYWNHNGVYLGTCVCVYVCGHRGMLVVGWWGEEEGKDLEKNVREKQITII